MKKLLYIDWHLGLGDAFICNGLVRTLARDRLVMIPAKPVNYSTVKELFSDLPEVTVVYTDRQRATGEIQSFCDALGIERIGLGYKSSLRFPGTPWEMEFYKQVGIPLHTRWSAGAFPKEWTKQSDSPPYAFVHEDGERGFFIHKMDSALAGVRPDPGQPFAEASRLMVNATEIHCIDSSFLNLAEGMYAKGLLKAKRLVWHEYARPGGYPPQALLAPWEIIS